MKKTVIFILLMLLMLVMVGCTQTVIDVVDTVTIRANSFNTIYDIDEKLNFDNIYIVVTYKSGQTTEIQCDETMIVGFDSSTTGDKTLHVEYKGVKSTTVEYKIVCKGYETVKVNTTARITITANPLPGEMGVGYVLGIKNGDLTKISAVVFTLSSFTDLNVSEDYGNLEITNLPTGWESSYKKIDKYNLKIIVYKASGIDIVEDINLANINVIEGKNNTAVGVSVTVSDGVKDYTLPNTK